MKARIKLNEGMSFVAETGSGHLVTMDGAPEGGGRNLGVLLRSGVTLTETLRILDALQTDELCPIYGSRQWEKLNQAERDEQQRRRHADDAGRRSHHVAASAGHRRGPALQPVKERRQRQGCAGHGFEQRFHRVKAPLLAAGLQFGAARGPARLGQRGAQR